MMSIKMSITQESLKEKIKYNPETGVFVWISAYRKKEIGTVAGCVHKQHTKSYRIICVNYRRYQSHRLAWVYMYGDIPDGYEIDHINGNGLDNRIINLRCVTRHDNCKNLRKPSHNRSGFCGVSIHKGTNKWRARIRAKGRYVSLGLFNNKNDAYAARKHAEKIYNYHPNHGSERPLY